MILSNVEIEKALDEGRVVIRPRPSPPPSDPKTPYDTTSVDLTLGDEVVLLKGGPYSVDLRHGKFAQLADKSSDALKITEDQPFSLPPSKFVLARTHEWVELPIIGDARNLCARVEGKSSFARCGMLVHFTAPTIHSGFKGHITLEIINLGPLSINLFPRMRICQLILEDVAGKPIQKISQFQNQTRPGGQSS